MPMTSVESAWLALRTEWPFPTRVTPGGLRLPGSVVGVACTAFAVGTEAVAWLDRLAQSEWCSGLRPTAEDFRASAGPHPWREGFMATVAMSARATDAELDAALALLSRLGDRRVVVTLGGPSTPSDALAGRLAERGAFVLRAASALTPGEMHHLPLRVATSPRHGRLIGIDLADVLAIWPPGRVGVVHAAPLAFRRSPHPIHEALAGYDQIETLYVDMHLDPADEGWTLADVDWLINGCLRWGRGLTREGFGISSSERNDGYDGCAELVVVGTEGVSRFNDETGAALREGNRS